MRYSTSRSRTRHSHLRSVATSSGNGRRPGHDQPVGKQHGRRHRPCRFDGVRPGRGSGASVHGRQGIGPGHDRRSEGTAHLRADVQRRRQRELAGCRNPGGAGGPGRLERSPGGECARRGSGPSEPPDLVAVLSNDFDRDGDLLAVTEATVASGTEVTVEVLGDAAPPGDGDRPFRGSRHDHLHRHRRTGTGAGNGDRGPLRAVRAQPAACGKPGLC